MLCVFVLNKLTFFCWTFGPGQLTVMLILEARFHKPTVPKVHPPTLQHMQERQVSWKIPLSVVFVFLFHAFDPNGAFGEVSAVGWQWRTHDLSVMSPLP